ncbi:MAG TPA: HAMP domain-containing sensor histidine kinase [Thermoanaerobaculia bacterium]|nr:HAMP domain-containing sensor histidine kinase [Thermoanaerobaculia bacterium]
MARFRPGRLTATPADRPFRASILLPFAIISIGLGVLAWRSYILSARLERGVQALAMQYAGYAADISARRIDSAVRAEIFRVSDEGQQIERGSFTPSADALAEWLNRNEWIVSAIFVPDSDPTNSIFVSERSKRPPGKRLQREFYTSSGLIRYAYDPGLLLDRVRPVLHQQPLMQSPQMQPHAELRLVHTPKQLGTEQFPAGFAHTVALASPLSDYAVRAVVRTPYATSGWQNARFASIWFTVLALALTALGAALALRGLLRESETMKLRGALIANISHELRTPLSMIRLGAETLKRSTRLTDKQREEIEDAVLREVLHLSHLVENVLDVARIQNRSTKALAFSPVRPRDLVTSVLTTYESWIRSKGFALSLQIEETVDEQLWDRDAVSRALLNLIDNAVKYSAEEKELTVVLRQSLEDVILEVKDRGIGIEPDDLQHIFDPYYRAQFSDTQTRRGAGLGLTLVQQIVASHGGRVEVESAAGAGSTFRLLFPRMQSGERQAAPGLREAPQTF